MGLKRWIRRKCYKRNVTSKTKSGGTRTSIALHDHYQDTYDKIIITDSIRLDYIDKKFKKYIGRFEEVAAKSYLPWYAIGFISYRESSFDFQSHLHNGDPLSRRTRRVPKGYPKTGTPPFTWEYSAIDALKKMGRGLTSEEKTLLMNGDIPALLWYLERYNGFGYMRRGVNSPYVWGCTSAYTKGRYVADGKWSKNAVSKRVGGAAILKMLNG